MGLLEQDIKELRELRQHYKAGKVNVEHVFAEIAIFSQIEKRAKLILMAHMVAKYSKVDFNRLVRANLIGDGSAIDTRIITIDETEKETIKCVAIDNALMERHECLDSSGSNKYPECEGCDSGLITKNILLGEKQT